MTFAERMAGLAAKTQERLGGEPITFRKVTPGTLAADTRKRTETIAEYALSAIVGPVEVDYVSVPGDSRQAKRRTFTVAAAELAAAAPGGVTPSSGDRILHAGVEWTLTKAPPESAGSVVVLHGSRG